MNENFYADSLAKIREDIRQVETEEARLQSELAEIRRRIQCLRSAEFHLAELAGELPTADVLPDGQPIRREPTYAEIIENVLREAGKPLRINEITASMIAIGRVLPSEKLSRYSTIGAVFARRPDKFMKVSRGLYTLKESKS